MKVDISPSLVEKMKMLFGILAEAHAEMEGTTYPDIYFDTQDTGDHNCDPLPFNTLNQDTLTLAMEVKAGLKL